MVDKKINPGLPAWATPAASDTAMSSWKSRMPFW